MQIVPNQTSFAPEGAPPSFRVKTDGEPFYAVQATIEPSLLNGALAARRTQLNFFDSWYGDDQARGGGNRPARREVAGQHLEAPTGRATYTLPAVIWRRIRGAPQLFYRLMVFADERRRRPRVSVEDVDWRRAPSVSIARLPAQPARSAVAAFRGRNVLDRADFIDIVTGQLQNQCLVSGRDGDFRYAVLKASCFHMTVVECHEKGLTDTVEAMPRKPDVIVNGQFISSITGIGTQGQVIREGALINPRSTPTRYYVAQTWRGNDVRDFHAGRGDPNALEPDARVAFGGLGPVLLGGVPVTGMTPWAQDIYSRSEKTGRGVIAVHRARDLILLLVQQDSAIYSSNSMTMRDLRDLVQRLGFTDAVFNDGSDSESLCVKSAWLLRAGYLKDEAMDFAIGFVERRRNRRFNVLAIDGTRSADGQAFVDGTVRPLITHYLPKNISDNLRTLPALGTIAGAFHSGLIQAWRLTAQAQANQIGRIIQQAGQGGHWADILYVSSHAWRHGQLWYHPNDVTAGGQLMIADPWSSNFRPSWRTTPRWLILSGCAVLGLRVSRGLVLDRDNERAHLVDFHRDIHGSGAIVPGLTNNKCIAFVVYHPGWVWYDRFFKVSGLRGVLGYWWRSPSGGRDEEIVNDFTEKLRKGDSFLDAWESANRGGLFQAQALWAGMVRAGCETDTLATLEDASLPPENRDFLYYDRFQRGRAPKAAFHYANTRDDSSSVGAVTIRYNSEYDQLALNELKDLSPGPTPANFLEYSDAVCP